MHIKYLIVFYLELIISTVFTNIVSEKTIGLVEALCPDDLYKSSILSPWKLFIIRLLGKTHGRIGYVVWYHACCMGLGYMKTGLPKELQRLKVSFCYLNNLGIEVQRFVVKCDIFNLLGFHSFEYTNFLNYIVVLYIWRTGICWDFSSNIVKVCLFPLIC
jgi:hypothetical protein